MKNNRFYILGLLLIVISILISCNNNNSKEQKKSLKIPNSSLDELSGFNDFLNNFQGLNIQEFSTLKEKFYNNFLFKEEKLIKVGDNYKREFCGIFNNDSNETLYYGFKYKYKNKYWIVVYYCSSDNNKNNSNNVTSNFSNFKLCLYDLKGTFLSFNEIIGTDYDGGIAPNYNIFSDFNIDENTFKINTVIYKINDLLEYNENQDGVKGKIITKEYILDNNKFFETNSIIKEAYFFNEDPYGENILIKVVQ